MTAESTDVSTLADEAAVDAVCTWSMGSQDDGGLGLRLLIARAVAEAHGGSLSALDEDGHLMLRCELPLQG